MSFFNSPGNRPVYKWGDYQASLSIHRETRRHAELIGLTGLALADALHFRRVEGVELVLAHGLLLLQATGTDCTRTVE